MKLKNKIISFTLVICIVSIVSMFIINYTSSIGQLKEELDQRVEYQTQSLSKELDSWLAVEKNSVEEIITSMIKTDSFEPEFAKNYLKEISEKNGDNDYYISFSDGEYIHHIYQPTSDPTQRPWYKGAIEANNEIFVSEPYIDSLSGNIVITISKKFTTLEGRVGVIASDIQTTKLIEKVSSADVGVDSYAFLVDQNKNILAHKNEEFQPEADSFKNLEKISDGKLLEIMNLDSEKRNLNKRKFIDYDNVEKLLFFQPL